MDANTSAMKALKSVFHHYIHISYSHICFANFYQCLFIPRIKFQKFIYRYRFTSLNLWGYILHQGNSGKVKKNSAKLIFPSFPNQLFVF